MVIDQVNIAGGVRVLVVPEDQPPVSCDSQAPVPFQVAFQRVQLPAGKPIELVQSVGSFQGEQKLVQLVRHRGCHPFGDPVFVELS
jgi:hypothetical protein